MNVWILEEIGWMEINGKLDGFSVYFLSFYSRSALKPISKCAKEMPFVIINSLYDHLYVLSCRPQWPHKPLIVSP